MLTVVPGGCPGGDGGKDASPSRAAGLAMAVTCAEAAQDRWRPVNAPHLIALVRAGGVFRDGVLVERPEPVAA